MVALTTPKTAASTRSIPVPQGVIEVLSEHVRVHGPGRDGVLLHQDGKYLSDNALNWQLRTGDIGSGT